jgi:L-ascorbate metabolism protein UlaG (beta-lactamase superfamily)
MKITKYEHACLILEEGSDKLIIDPGVFAKSLPSIRGVVAIVITHVHGDHLDKDLVKRIMSENPNAKIYSTQQTAEATDLPIDMVSGGDERTVGAFALKFNGGQHAIIDKLMPTFENVGVTVNGKFYYPGDSFTPPEGEMEVIAVPAMAPWAKISESADFMRSNKAKLYFPTHNGFLPEQGQVLYNDILRLSAEVQNATFTYLEISKNIEF